MIEQIKKTAVHLADVFICDEDEFEKEYDGMKNDKYITIISKLAQLYYNIKVGIVSRRDAVKIQNRILDELEVV
ncbi:MAG: hypothetical protein IKY39_01900 [Clostridia bacterium]|nr:hypothetical protein [Clostridia bacterium]